MKSKKLKFGLVLFATFVALLASLILINPSNEPDPKGLVFLTVGLDQLALPNENSSYEVQRATEHFSNVVLGWTLEPSFETGLEERAGYAISVSGRSQEKENLIFILSAEEAYLNYETGDLFLDELELYFKDYNEATKSGYTIAVYRYSNLETVWTPLRSIFGVTLFIFLLSSVILISWEYASRNRS